MKNQHRLCRLQIVNWGTFSGYVDLPVPRSGLLLTGPSGSGKSSLLDAMASVLVHPKWLSFNAAAQEGSRGDRARSLATYIRGAYERKADEGSGEVTTEFLRAGAVWSGIALTYDNLAGQVTTLIRLMHLGRGTNSTSDVTSLFLLAEQPVDLLTLASYVENGLDKRRLKQTYQNWFIDDVYSAFAHQLQRRFGLASDTAQHLLHKTQSAKNLDSLDELLRNFMLDEPKTFRLRDEAITQFAELRSAHATVVDARSQVQTLVPLRRVAELREETLAKQQTVVQQAAHVETIRLRLRVSSAERELNEMAVKERGVKREIELASEVVGTRKQDRDEALLRVKGLGGQDLDSLNAEAARLQADCQRAASERSKMAAITERCGLAFPEDELGMAEFATEVARLLGSLTETSENRERLYGLAVAHDQARKDLARINDELELARRQSSNMDPGLLRVREQLVVAGAPPGRLPFVGELLAVRADQTEWTGAIERVLHSFARTMLVPEDLYPLVSEYVDGRRLTDTDGRGVRLVYERVPTTVFGEPAEVDDDLLWCKLEVTEGETASWLRQRLVRFDYRCVGSAAELRGVTRGVTRAGQVRHSTSRHEKDDRRGVTDQRYWVLGSSATARRETLLAEQSRAKSRLAKAEHDRDVEEAAARERVRLAHQLETLRELRWDDFDVGGRQRALVAVQGRIQAHLNANTGLVEAKTQLSRADAELVTAEDALRNMDVGVRRCR